MEDLKKYFYDYILKPISCIVYTQRIYKDFQRTCLSLKFYEDSFTHFIDKIYYKTMITDLCRLLDKPKKKDDKTFQGFIELFKEKESEIIDERKKVKVVNLDSGDTENIDVSSAIKHDFDKVKHDEKIKELESSFELFRQYRNKVNCHQTSEVVSKPTNEQIDRTVSILEDLLQIYAKLFGIHLLSVIPNPVYKNPPFKALFSQRP